MEETALKWLFGFIATQITKYSAKTLQKWYSSITDKRGTVSDIYGIELLKVLIAQNPNTETQLIEHQNLAEICMNQKQLTLDQVAILSGLFGVPQEAFLPMSLA